MSRDKKISECVLGSHRENINLCCFLNKYVLKMLTVKEVFNLRYTIFYSLNQTNISQE